MEEIRQGIYKAETGLGHEPSPAHRRPKEAPILLAVPSTTNDDTTTNDDEESIAPCERRLAC